VGAVLGVHREGLQGTLTGLIGGAVPVVEVKGNLVVG